MKWLPKILERRRLIVAAALLLALTGGLSWMTMPREEDPQFPHRDALLVIRFPGADAETVERLVVEPVEEHLAEVEEIDHIFTTARAGVAILHLELHETVYAVDDAWDSVEDAVAEARRDFPSGVLEPSLDDDLVSQEAVVLAITGSADPLVLASAAEILRDALLDIDAVQEITEIGDPGEQITVEYDAVAARRLGIDPFTLGRLLGARSEMVPGGILHLGAKTANLRPQTEFRSLEEIARTPIVLPSGASIPLGEVARVRHGPREPAGERMRWNGEPAVAVGVVPQDNLDRVLFGEEVRAKVAEIAPRLAPLEVEEIVFQPDLVSDRLRELSGSLRLGILIVAAVLFLAMGLRLGALVASVVPLVAFGAIALYAAGGGILNQISIAALVIALGMLVDNAIVVAENIQWRLDRGEPVHEASADAVRELAMPLGTATGTTLAAFVPMWISKGNTADFTRALPIIIMTTLALSYVFAVLVTPVLAELVLRARRDAGASRLDRWADRVAGIAVRRAGWVLLVAAVALPVVLWMGGGIDRQFFPAADRSLVILDLEMPEGTHLDATDDVARRAEAAFIAHPGVTSVATFIGRAAPKFYYNLLSRPDSPHRAQIVAQLDDLSRVEPTLAWARDWVRRELPEASGVARRLEQGPPVEAPLEVRVYGESLEEMGDVADALLAEIRAIPGTRDVRHDLGLGVPTVRFEIDDAAAGRHGLSRADVARTLAGRTLGAEIGQYRAGDDPVPILVRSSEGDELPPSQLAGLEIPVPNTVGKTIPLAQVARLELEWRPAAIYHRDRRRLVTVQSQLAEGVTAHEAFALLEPRLAEIELPPGVRLELGGELEEAGRANAALLRTMPLGVLMLLVFLLAEFNSFRRVAIILVTVPLAALGVVPGLLLSQQPFGFMSMLGLISLVGIVVNNAIVLIDVIESQRDDGMEINDALAEAVRRRTRPILLTMVTTVAGLSPLAFSGTTLWPPLAWAMISGLIASTFLTLLVVPALYKVLFPPGGWRNPFARRTAPATSATAVSTAVLALVLAASLAAPRAARADEPVRMTLAEAMDHAAERPLLQGAEARARAAERGAEAARRAAWWPTVDIVADASRRDRDYLFDTPLGAFALGERSSQAATVAVTQPLYDVAARRGAGASRAEADSASAEAGRLGRQLRLEAAERFLAVVAIDARRRATEAFLESLAARLEETESRVDAGRSLEIDALKLRLDLESAELDLVALSSRRQVALRELGRAVGVDGPVEPDWISPEPPAELPDADILIPEALAARQDLAAVKLRLEALELRAAALRGERLPRLQAQARWQMSNGDPFRADELGDGLISLAWRPFAAGTRAPRRAALDAERDALRADLTELEQETALEIRTALADLETAREALRVRGRGVELAEETLRVERERHRAGRATTNDLLDAEAGLRRQRTEHELARIDAVRAGLRLELATGRI